MRVDIITTGLLEKLARRSNAAQTLVNNADITADEFFSLKSGIKQSMIHYLDGAEEILERSELIEELLDIEDSLDLIERIRSSIKTEEPKSEVKTEQAGQVAGVAGS